MSKVNEVAAEVVVRSSNESWFSEIVDIFNSIDYSLDEEFELVVSERFEVWISSLIHIKSKTTKKLFVVVKLPDFPKNVVALSYNSVAGVVEHIVINDPLNLINKAFMRYEFAKHHELDFLGFFHCDNPLCDDTE